MASQATTLFRARVPAKRLKNVEKVFRRIGLTPGEAVNAFLAQVEINRGLPFPVRADPVEDGYAYARSEYGLTREEADAFSADIHAEVEEARRNGMLREIK
jgi:antitoxin component of RelBE/YafQ-DinJ toxin-antitoxin module